MKFYILIILVLLDYILISYFIIINDIGEYVLMYPNKYRTEYLEVAFLTSIYLLIGTSMLFIGVRYMSLILVFFSLIIILITDYSINLYKYGIMPMTTKKQEVSFVLFNIPSSRARRDLFITRWKNTQTVPLHIYIGLEGPKHFEEVKNYPVLYEFLKNNKLDENKNPQTGSFALAKGLKRGFETNFTLTNPHKWIVVFEDDAVLNPNFNQGLQNALEYYKELDIIWLDSIHSWDWIFRKKISYCTSGMIYKLSSLKKLAALFEFDTDEYIHLVKTWQSTIETPWNIDLVLAHYCNIGKLKCGHAPLTHESSDYTSTIR